MLVLRPAPMFAWRSHFDRCSASPGAHANTMLMLRLVHMSTRHPYPSGVPDSSGAHAWPDVYAHLALMLRPVPMFARRSCSPDGHVSPNAHARPTLMLHPMLEGDRSGTYRARTLEINPPWQETCNMLDFETPDAK